VSQVSKTPGMATTAWEKERTTFVVGVSNVSKPSLSTLLGAFTNDLLSCFEAESAAAGGASPQSTVSAAKSTRLDTQREQAAGLAAGVPRTMSGVQLASPVAASSVEYLPEVETTARPEQMLTRAPYHLIISKTEQFLDIQGSHPASIQFLAEYLKKWGKQDLQDARKVCRIKPRYLSRDIRIADINGGSHPRLPYTSSSRRLAWV
jgi:hypothetical protein